MKKFLIPLLFLLIVSPASAHEWQYYKNISVLLHTNPDDNPIAGTMTRLIFFFGKGERPFDVSKCNCSITVFKDSSLLGQNKLSILGDKNYGSNVLFADFFFPKKGVYAVHLGAAPPKKEFEPFGLVYNLRVDQELPPQHSLLSSLVGLAVFILASLSAINIARWILRKVINKQEGK